MTSPSCFCSASGASVVAIDNKIEQAMVSKITIFFKKKQKTHSNHTPKSSHVKYTIRKQLTLVLVIFLALIPIDHCVYLYAHVLKDMRVQLVFFMWVRVRSAGGWRTNVSVTTKCLTIGLRP